MWHNCLISFGRWYNAFPSNRIDLHECKLKSFCCNKFLDWKAGKGEPYIIKIGIKKLVRNKVASGKIWFETYVDSLKLFISMPSWRVSNFNSNIMQANMSVSTFEVDRNYKKTYQERRPFLLTNIFHHGVQTN